MDWNKFAKEINGKYKEYYDGGLGGDTLIQEIIQRTKNAELKITKKTRRGYEASSHFNVEKFQIEFRHDDLKFFKNRIRRKNWFFRIFRDLKDQYKIDGEFSPRIEELINSTTIKILLGYPKSEFYSIENRVVFRCQSLGKMHENLPSMFKAFTDSQTILFE